MGVGVSVGGWWCVPVCGWWCEWAVGGVCGLCNLCVRTYVHMYVRTYTSTYQQGMFTFLVCLFAERRPWLLQEGMTCRERLIGECGSVEKHGSKVKGIQDVPTCSTYPYHASCVCLHTYSSSCPILC